ncbi:hypothetical protein KR038_006029 [Drosophila bunnanda]|nr:hypothetical protein KR038_006029 [Drosophila bunnanda]
MSKRVSIILPEEMPLGLTKHKNVPRPKPILRSSNRVKPSMKSDLVPPVFVFVSPEISGISEASTPRTSITSPSDSSLNNSTGGSMDVQAEAPKENSALALTRSPNNKSTSSIKQFLRNTVSLVRAGESFTSVKQLFYNFIKQNSSPSEEELASRRLTQDSTICSGNPYLCESNDTLVSNSTPHLTTPSTSLMSTCTRHSNYLYYPLKDDMPTSWLSDVSPLTGYTTDSTYHIPKEDYQSDFSQKSYVSVQAQSKNQDITSIQTQSESHEVALVKSNTLPTEGGLPCSPSKNDLTPEQVQGEETKTSPGPLKTLTLVSSIWATRHIRGRGGSSSRSLSHFLKRISKRPWRSPKMSPRSEALTTASSESASDTETLDKQSVRSSGSSRKSSQVSVGKAARKTSQVSPRSSVTSNMSQKAADEVLDKVPSTQIERICTSCENRSQNANRGSQATRRVNFVFTIVSPEEGGPEEGPEGGPEGGAGEGRDEGREEGADPIQPGGSTDKDLEETSTCRTFQEECKCHHCQDMRRAVKRVEFFQSPEGQKRMEAKLLSKNFFMDLCALSKVREEIQANLYGTQTHPPSRVSYPVSICGASRLDGGSLTLTWFTHDLECVDHFDFFVDDRPSKSVFNKRATTTVLIDVNASQVHRLKMRAVPERGYGAEASQVDKLMSEVAAGHMRNVRQGQLFARCLKFLDAEPQRSLVDYWTDSEFLYMPTSAQPPRQKGR